MPGPEPHIRHETGKMDFPGDWPGIFIRGDEALEMARQARWLINHPEPHVRIERFLKRMAILLESCQVTEDAE